MRHGQKQKSVSQFWSTAEEKWCLQVNNHIRWIMFASWINDVAKPYGVHLIPSCSAVNEECSNVENNYENGALNKYSDWYNTAIMNRLIKITIFLWTAFLWQSQKTSCRLVVAYSRKVLQCYCCEGCLTCSLWELSDNTWNDGRIPGKFCRFTESTQASIHSKSTTKSWDGIIG